jgi:FkbM family methyltransferase
MHEFVTFNRTKVCRYGTMVYNVNDCYVGRSLDLYGEYSEGEVALFRQIVRPGDAVLDIGANIGTHTLFFARQVGTTGAVFAVEPQRVVFQTLCANMALNNVTNAWCFPCALGTEPGDLVVPRQDYARMGNFGGVSLSGVKDGERVPVMTVDGLNVPRCRLIKLDVEGAEECVLRGAVRTIERDKPAIYAENDREERSDGLVRFIASLGYELFWHRPPLFNPNNFAKNTQNVFGAIASHNILCVPRNSFWKIEGLKPVEIPS